MTENQEIPRRYRTPHGFAAIDPELAFANEDLQNMLNMKWTEAVELEIENKKLRQKIRRLERRILKLKK